MPTASPDETDWPQVATLYAEFARQLPTPVVELNRAVAMADGPLAGLRRLPALEDELDEYRLFHATRADLLRRAGQDAPARASYQRALELTVNERERRHLLRRLRELDG